MLSRKQLIKLLASSIVEQITAVLVGMVDAVMVAAAGEAAIPRVLLVDSVSVLIIQIMEALATGGAVISARHLGKMQSRDVCKVAGQLVIVTLALSMVVTGIAIPGSRHLLGAIFGRVEILVMDNAQTYFWIAALFYPFTGLYNACMALFRSMGNSKASMMISLMMNVINTVGNAVCMFGLGMGVTGVAYPTLLSRIVTAVMMLVLIQNRYNSIRLSSLKLLVPDVRMIKNILSIDIPGGLESGMFQFGKILLRSLVPSLGMTVIASYVVTSNLVIILYLPGTAIELGLITIAGQCAGAGRLAEAKHCTKTLMGMNYGTLAVLSTAMVVFSGQLVGIYHLLEQVSRLSREPITAHSIAMILWPLASITPHTLRASLDVKFTMAVAVFPMWAFRIGFAYLFVNICKLGVMGVWYGTFIGWILRAFVFSWRFKGFEKRAVVAK